MGVWEPLGNPINGVAPDDKTGWSVSMNKEGNIVAVGAVDSDINGTNSGLVRIYKYNEISNNWAQLGQDITGTTAFENAGRSVSLDRSGNFVAIGASGANNPDVTGFYEGSLRVFSYSQPLNLWQQVGQTIYGVYRTDNLGNSVALTDSPIFGLIAACASPYNDNESGSDSGMVQVFHYNTTNSTWEQLGQNITGKVSNELLGYSISLNENGDILSIGAPWSSKISYYGGIARVYKYNNTNTTWEQLGQDLDNTYVWGNNGMSTSLSRDGYTLAVGSIYVNNENGTVYVYKYNLQNNVWSLYGNEISAIGQYEQNGMSVSLSDDGNKVAVGADWYTVNNVRLGSTRVYGINNNQWELIGEKIDGLVSEGSGYSVSLNGDGTKVASGSFVYNSATGLVRVYKYNPITTLNINNTKTLTHYSSPILLALTHSRTDLVQNVISITDYKYTSNTGVAYAQNTGQVGIVSRFTISLNDTQSQPVTDFSSEPINLVLTLPMANTANSPLKLFKINPSNNEKIITPDYNPSGRNVTYNSVTGKWETTLPSLSTFIVVDPVALSSGVGGDPHVQTVHGEHHLLPNDWKVVKLYEHNDMKVVVKCQHINDEVVEQLHKFDERRNIISINKDVHKYVTDLTYMTELAVLKHNEEVFKMDLLNDKVLLHNQEDVQSEVKLEKLEQENEEGLFSLTHKRVYPKQNLSSYLLHLDSNNVMKVQIDNFWDDINFVKLHLFDKEHVEEYSGEFFKHDEVNRLE